MADLISGKLALLQEDKFFESEEKIESLAAAEYDKEKFEDFKKKIKIKLIEICNKFLEKQV